jgi:hypothetical protein
MKTFETALLTLNRQIWTEQKAFFMARDKGGGGGGSMQNCRICGQRENTEHHIFKCPKYSAKISEELNSVLKTAINRLGSPLKM